MKRIFVMGKQVMLAAVLFAGLSVASCYDDMSVPEYDKPAPEEPAPSDDPTDEDNNNQDQAPTGTEMANPVDAEHGAVAAGTALDGTNKVDFKPEGAKVGDKIAVFYEATGDNPQIALRSVDVDAGGDMMCAPFGGLDYKDGYAAVDKSKTYLQFEVTEDILAAFTKSATWGGPYLSIQGKDIKITKAILVAAAAPSEPEKPSTDPTPSDGPVDLTATGFGKWSDWVNGEKLSDADCAYELGVESSMPYGDGSVNNYIDISDYKTLEIVVTEGTPRPLLNRDVAEGQAPDHLIDLARNADQKAAYLSTNDNGDGSTTYIIDLAKIKADKGFVHLHAIKGDGSVTVTSMKLTGGSAPSEPSQPSEPEKPADTPSDGSDFRDNFVIAEGPVVEKLDDGSIKITPDGNYNGKIVYKFPEAVPAGKKISIDIYTYDGETVVGGGQFVWQDANGTIKYKNDKGEDTELLCYNWSAESQTDVAITVPEGVSVTQVIINNQDDGRVFVIKSVTIE